MIRRLFTYLRARRLSSLAQERQQLVYTAFKGGRGSLVAQHKLTALTTAQLRIELGR